VRGSNKTSVALSPMVEFGGRITASENTNLRLFAAMGMCFFPDNTRVIDASVVGASPADGTFRSFTKAPGILGNFDVGAQLYSAEGLEVKAEYNAKVGGSFLSHGGSLRLAYPF
jgi:hypothetical protein